MFRTAASTTATHLRSQRVFNGVSNRPPGLRSGELLHCTQIRLISLGSKDYTHAHSIAVRDGAGISSHLKDILSGNKRWVEEKKAEDPLYFEKLGQPQTPKYLYFGCSDSRVPANQILGMG